jgi:hypothetical protein
MALSTFCARLFREQMNIFDSATQARRQGLRRVWPDIHCGQKWMIKSAAPTTAELLFGRIPALKLPLNAAASSDL